MRFGVISDTHGNLDGLSAAVEYLTQELQCKRIFHLGHDTADVDEFLALRRTQLRQHDDGDSTDFFSDLAEALTTTLDLPTRTVLKADSDELGRLRRLFVRVPGEGDESYGNGHHAHIEYEMLGDRIIGLVHNVKEMKKEDIATAHIVFYGGSHLYQVDKVGHRWFINPGHMMNGADKGREPTFGFLDASEEVPIFKILDLNRQAKLVKELTLDKKNKFSVTG
jgi:predicted phosphodiesterase